ncbi:MAG: hypothetical protein WC509_03885 [Candidatus Izemoplasmatales bacterium]
MQIELVNLDPKSIAFANDRDETLANAKLEAFLANAGIVPEHRFQNELVIKKDGKRLAVYIKYASVPRGTPKTKDVNVADMAGGPALKIRISPEEYVPFTDGDLMPRIREYLDENRLGIDNRQANALAEPHGDGYDVYLPVKGK